MVRAAFGTGLVLAVPHAAISGSACDSGGFRGGGRGRQGRRRVRPVRPGQCFRFGAAIGATDPTLIVHPRIRGASTALIDAALGQAGLFGVTLLDGNARAAPLYGRHRTKPWPSERGDLNLISITDPLAILAERAVRGPKNRTGSGARPTAERFMRDRVFQTELVRLGRTGETARDGGPGRTHRRLLDDAGGRGEADGAPRCSRAALAVLGSRPDPRSDPAGLDGRRRRRRPNTPCPS